MKINKEATLIRKILVPYVKAWNLFFDISLPISNTIQSESGTSNKNDSEVLYFIPVIGLTLGLFAYILSWFVSIAGGVLLASIICPFIIVLVWESLNHAKDTSSLVKIIYFKIFKHYNDDSVSNDTKEINFMYFYIFAAIFIIRILCIGIFIYHNSLGWIIVTTVLTYSVQAHVATEQKNNSNYALISADKKSIIIMWIIAGIFCFVFGAVFFPSMILAFIVAVLIAVKAKNQLEKNNSLSGISVGFTGKYTELIILLLGLVFGYNL